MIRTARGGKGPFNVDDFFSLIRDGEKGDLINGDINRASPDSPRANDICFFLGTLVRCYVAEKKLGGRTYFSRVGFILDDSHAPEPDLAYIRNERLHVIGSGRVNGPRDLAFEIVSHDSLERDYELKRTMYEAAGVTEYWIIDPIENACCLLILEDGRYHEMPPDSHYRFHSQVLPGLWLKLDWLFNSPLPDELQCLRQILAG